MHITDDEVLDLSAFFSKRFPTPSERHPIALRAGLIDGDWTGMLRQARDEGRLGNLAAAARAQAPDDANLREMCALLGGRPAVSARVTALVSGALLLAVAVGAAGVAWTLRESAEASPTPPVPMEAAVVPIPEPPPAQVGEETLPVIEDGAQAVGKDTSAPEPKHARAPVVAPPSADAGWCRGDAQGIVGYWYAGPTSPGTAGETIAIGRSANVRAEYPQPSNHFNKRARIRCSVTIGTQMRLSHEPIRVAGGHYWVPLADGDLG